jgi:hypothetical protein
VTTSSCVVHDEDERDDGDDERGDGDEQVGVHVR